MLSYYKAGAAAEASGGGLPWAAHWALLDAAAVAGPNNHNRTYNNNSNSSNDNKQ